MNKYHHPPHLFLDNIYYFITSRTYQRRKVFNTDDLKNFLLDSLKDGILKVGYDLVAWVVLDDHYHILIKVRNAKNLSKLMRNVHGHMSYQINKIRNTIGQKVFHNYWDHCIRDETDFWKHLYYIHHNPIKHGYARAMEDYGFSSYRYWLEIRGEKNGLIHVLGHIRLLIL